MRKTRIYIFLAANTIIIYGLVFLLLPAGSTEQLTVVGIAMILMMVAPYLVAKRELSTLVKDVETKSSELTRSNELLEQMRMQMQAVTTIDELTGAYNLRHFKDLVFHQKGLAGRGSYEFTVCMVEIDRFDEIIKKFGVEKSNNVLQIFTSVVKAALREIDVIARIQGQKFGLILSGASEEVSLAVVSRVSQLLSQIQVSDKEEFQVTASTGIAAFRADDSVDDLIDHAETALNFAIQQGRDCVAGYLPSEATSPATEEGT